jgi:hypothetical protein
MNAIRFIALFWMVAAFVLCTLLVAYSAWGIL